MAGVAGLPQINDINGCDSDRPEFCPVDSAGNPRKCRTERPPLIHQLDCQSRREKDPTKRMQIELLMAQIRDGSPEVEPYLKRQVELMMKPKED